MSPTKKMDARIKCPRMTRASRASLLAEAVEPHHFGAA
jgi:hypothetical protein